MRAAPRGDRGGRGGGGCRGRRGPPVAPGRCLSPRDPPPASGTWESWGHFERQHPVRWEAARPAGEKIPGGGRAAQTRTAVHPIWAKRNSSDLECKATPSGLAFLPHPHLPQPGHPTEESRRLGPEVAKSNWEGVRGAPTKPRLLLTKAESPAPAQGPAQQRRRQKATPTTAAPGPSP